MNVREFTEKEIQRLILFREYWEKENKNEPDDFPPEMEEIDWVEQYTFFLEKE